MLQNAGVLYILPCKCAWRHSGVQFFDIKPPKSGPYPSVFPHFDLQICFAPQRRAIFWTSERPKWVRDRCVFHVLTYKYASRHSRVAFWNIGTSKMAPGSWCFAHFDLQMCFAPQRRAIFEHRNFQNGSGIVVFCAFWLANVLRATAACNFWTSQLPKWLRPCGVLCILTCKCAFRHSRVPFFTCPRNSYLRTRRFSEPTFRTSGTTIHWENTAIRDFTNIFRARWTACERLYAHVDLLASDLTDVDLLATDMTAVRLCFSTLHIVGS